MIYKWTVIIMAVLIFYVALFFTLGVSKCIWKGSNSNSQIPLYLAGILFCTVQTLSKENDFAPLCFWCPKDSNFEIYIWGNLNLMDVQTSDLDGGKYAKNILEIHTCLPSIPSLFKITVRCWFIQLEEQALTGCEANENALAPFFLLRYVGYASFYHWNCLSYTTSRSNFFSG